MQRLRPSTRPPRLPRLESATRIVGLPVFGLAMVAALCILTIALAIMLLRQTMSRNKLRRIAHEYGSDLLIILLAVTLVLLSALFVQGLADNPERLRDLAAVLDVGTKLLGGALMVSGAVVGYRRYLKGRVFAERLRLSMASRPVRWLGAEAGGNRRLLNALDVEAENIGDSTVWEPRLGVSVLDIESGASLIPEPPADSISGPAPRLGIAGIEPGEIVAFHTRFELPLDVPAFRVSVELRSSRGVWHRSTTLSNRIGNDGAEQVPHSHAAGATSAT